MGIVRVHRYRSCVTIHWCFKPISGDIQEVILQIRYISNTCILKTKESIAERIDCHSCGLNTVYTSPILHIPTPYYWLTLTWNTPEICRLDRNYELNPQKKFGNLFYPSISYLFNFYLQDTWSQSLSMFLLLYNDTTQVTIGWFWAE